MATMTKSRRSSKKRRKSIILILMTIVLTVLFIMGAAYRFTGDEEYFDTPLIALKELNKEVTNEMSQFTELEALDKRIEKYLRRWAIKGASLAITRNDSLVYAKGYGWADEEKEIYMEPGHIMRVASVSKLITAVGIMVLQDQGKMSIKDKVFGPEGILNDEFFNELIKKDSRYQKITVEDVLRHRGGFRRDPLFSSIDVQNQMRLDHPPTKEDYFRLVLSQKLRAVPGTYTSYSNFGYLLLSEIIEKVAGESYETFIRKNVLNPAGCYDMHIGGIYYEDRRENEVRYYTHEGDGKYIADFSNPEIMVERCYGGTNLPLLSGAGAWCASPIELARFVASINGNEVVEDIISKESLNQMIEYHDANTYSLGWNDTDPRKGWNRTGTLAGTSALIRHYPNGECWILVTNTSTYKGPRFTKNTDALFTECRKAYSSKLPAQNLFE
jgi:CubicO group peptidase (beta-lactamase class C family)